MKSNETKDKKELVITAEKKILSRLAVIMSILVLFISVSYAWYSNKERAKTDQIYVYNSTTVGFKISEDGNIYKYDLEEDYPDNLKLEPISGDGDKFYKPHFGFRSGDPEADDTTWEELPEYDEYATENYYFKKTLYFKADRHGFVSIKDLAIRPANTSERLISSTITQTVSDSSKGISKDYIACAARFTLKNYNMSGNLLSKYLFICMDNYAINVTEDTTGGSTVYDCTLVDDVKITSSDIYYYKYYDGENIALYGNNANMSILTESSVNNTALYIAELTYDSSLGGYYSKAEICFWIEGFDNEAIDLLSGGKITANINFEYNEYEVKSDNS